MLRLIISLLFFSSVVFAEDERVSGLVTLSADTVHHGNYFAMGNSVEISGTVEGDVYVLASQIIIDGHVKGDLLICGGNVDMSGRVDHNIRVLAGQVTISGSVGNNVTAVGGNVHLAQSARIKGGLVCAAGSVELASQIDQDVSVSASSLRISGTIGERLFAYVGKMRISSKAAIAGDVEYRSSNDAIIEPDAKIGGEIIHHPSFVHRVFKGGWIQKLLAGSKLAVILMNFIYSFVIGWILLRLFPKNVDAALDALSRQPIKALTYGLTLLILLPLASLLLLMTILGVPFALTLIALNVIGFYTAKIFSILWATEEVLKRSHFHMKRLTALAVGLVFYFILASLPYFGFILTLAVLVFGLGAAALGGLKRRA